MWLIGDKAGKPSKRGASAWIHAGGRHPGRVEVPERQRLHQRGLQDC